MKKLLRVLGRQIKDIKQFIVAVVIFGSWPYAFYLIFREPTDLGPGNLMNALGWVLAGFFAWHYFSLRGQR